MWRRILKKPRRYWEAQNEHMAEGTRALIAVLGLILLVLVAFAGSLLVLQPRKLRDDLKNELQEAREELARAKQEVERARERYLWMQDPEYLEQIARDVAQQAYPEERVIQQTQEPEAEEQGTEED